MSASAPKTLAYLKNKKPPLWSSFDLGKPDIIKGPSLKELNQSLLLRHIYQVPATLSSYHHQPLPPNPVYPFQDPLVSKTPLTARTSQSSAKSVCVLLRSSMLSSFSPLPLSPSHLSLVCHLQPPSQPRANETSNTCWWSCKQEHR